jgi:hypothetical protein
MPITTRGQFVMGKNTVLFFCLLLLSSHLISSADARELRDQGIRPMRSESESAVQSDLYQIGEGVEGRYVSAAVDTYCIVWYDFEPYSWQGWTQFDYTNDDYGTWFHADDFDGLNGGYAGRLVPIEGTKSIWCGARPDDEPYGYMCSWQNAPGYGNGWNQVLATPEFGFGGVLRLSYSGVFDSESGWDWTFVEYFRSDEELWYPVCRHWSGIVDTVVTHELFLTQNKTKLRFRFLSDGAFSDQDGLYESDGACIIDEITISDDYGVIDYEDFEAWDVGATSADGSLWSADPNPDEIFGTYSGLWTGLQDKDPCGDNFGAQIVFFIGSPYPSADYPGFYDTPFCMNSYNGWFQSPCQRECVISPVIDLTRFSTGCDEVQNADIPTEDLDNLGGALLRFTTYRDLYVWNMVWYTWEIRNVDPVTGCPGPWLDFNMVFYGDEKAYIYECHDIGSLIESDQIQVRFTVMDTVNDWWCCFEIEGHTPSPWFDNVRVYRYSKLGPQWSYRWMDLFQDNFPEDEFDLESCVRADAANDLNASDDPVIHPGDSVVVGCTSQLAGGLREGGVTGGEEVYCHLRVTDIGPFGKPALFGPQLVGDYGTYVSDDGEWTVIQCPTALSGGVNPVEGTYMLDLNDALLTRGYMIEYYFEAYDLDDERSTLPEHAGEGQSFEFTCLPTGKSDILYVDDFHGRDAFAGLAELYWNATFEAVLSPENQPDRYDVNSPTSMVSNGPGSRAYLNHVKRDEVNLSGYKVIIWDSGYLDAGTITDGSPESDKSDDATLLVDWLDQSENDVGLLVCGDDVAYDLDGLSSPQSGELMNTWCGVELTETSYFDMTGGIYESGTVSPYCIMTSAWPGSMAEDLYVFGGCPNINRFDVLTATANGLYAVCYPDHEGGRYAAAIRSVNQNAAGYYAKTMWFGFSWMLIRHEDPFLSVFVRFYMFDDLYQWFNGTVTGDSPDRKTPAAYRLCQNFPNPFNPATTIRFDIKKKGHVRLRIYNVAGQLVKTLVDDVMDAGSYAKEWKGSNNAGAEAASGVYFYRLEAGEYENVKKMVLLR